MADAAEEDNIYREAEVPGAPPNGNVEGAAAHEAEGNIQEQVNYIKYSPSLSYVSFWGMGECCCHLWTWRTYPRKRHLFLT